MGKLTRKEIVREDTFHASIRNTYESLATHKQKILVGVGLVIVASVGLFTWEYFQSKWDSESRYAFNQALETYHAPVVTTAEPSANPPQDGSLDSPAPLRFQSENEKYSRALKEFSELSKRRGSRQTKLLSQYYVGLSQEKLGKTDDAIKTLETIKSKFSDPRYSFLVKKTLAGIYEIKGELNSAIKINTELLNDMKSSYPKDEILMALGRSFEAQNNKEEAIKKYSQLAKEYPSSQNQREANDRLAKLGAKKITPPESATMNPLLSE